MKDIGMGDPQELFSWEQRPQWGKTDEGAESNSKNAKRVNAVSRLL